jgi:hypothetical protein
LTKETKYRIIITNKLCILNLCINRGDRIEAEK